jgi:hypothetical protein
MEIITDLRTQRVLLLSILIGLTCSILNLLFNDHIGNDTAGYYTRMAHEFIEGNYERAYFHLVPPLVPTLAGLIGKLGFSAWMSMKLVSCIFFLGGVYWIYRLACLRLSPDKAQWCSLLFLVCPRLLRYGMAGQLDAAKIFFLIFIFERLINFIQTKKWKLLFHTSIALALLALCRNEGIGYFAIVGIFILFGEWFFPAKKASGYQKFFKGVGRNVVAVSICLLIWSPWLIYEYRHTGYPVLGSKQPFVLAKFFRFLNIKETPFVSKLYSRFKQAENSYNKEMVSPKKGTTGLTSAENVELEKKKNLYDLFKEPEPFSVHSKIVETVKGIYPPYFLLVILGVWHLLISKGWTRIDSLFAAVFIFNILLQWIVVPDVLKRLIAPTIPFYLPWFIFGFTAIKGYIADKVKVKNTKNSKIISYGFLSLVIAIMLWDGMSSTRKSLRGKDETVRQIGLWIQQNRQQLNINKTEPLKSTLQEYGYHNGRQPVIATYTPQIAYWADADLLQIMPNTDVKQILNLFRERNIDMLILDKKFRKTFPDFNPDTPHFKLITNRWEDDGFLVYFFYP